MSWQVFAIGSAFFAALTAIFGKIGVAGINSNLATFIRTIVILIVTGAIISIRQQWQRPESISTKAIIFLVLSGLATGLSWLLYYRALQLGEASKVASVDKFSVFFVVIFSILFLGETLNVKSSIGTALILCGTILLVY